MINDFKVGYAKVNINPPLGSALFGYYVKRLASGYLDDLEASAIALVKGEKKFLIISIDNCSIGKELVNKCTEAINEATGIPRENVLISATHTHTGGILAVGSAFDADPKVAEEYKNFIGNRIADAVKLGAILQHLGHLAVLYQRVDRHV